MSQDSAVPVPVPPPPKTTENGQSIIKGNQIILVTGCCGFVGFHLCRQLFQSNVRVIGWDTESVHYPTTTIRHHRKDKLLAEAPNSFTFKDVNIDSMEAVSGSWDPSITHIIHLAARAGVRQSLTEPTPYIMTNVLDKVHHFLYASSSSVYGKDSQIPFKETDSCNQPVSLYAATKKADELMSYSYSHLYKLPTTGLRFFTVYGPWGRPDMAVYEFTRNIDQGKPITVFNHGNNRRAFTYVDDVVNGILACLRRPPSTEVTGNSDGTPYKVYNIGTCEMVTTHRLIEILEKELGKTAKIEYTGPIACDMTETCADLTELEHDMKYKPKIQIDTGLSRFIEWYKQFYANEITS